MIKYLFTCVMLVMMSGCCHDTKLSIAKVPHVAKYTVEDYLLTKDQSIVVGKKLEAAWWSLFANQTLSNLIEQAVRDNYDVVVAKEALLQAEQAVKSVRGSLWPQIDLLANAGRQKYGVGLFGPAPIKIPPFTYYELGPALSWQIDFFGQTKYTIKQKEALMRYQQYTLEAVYISLTSNVVAQALEIAAVHAEIDAVNIIVNEDIKMLDLLKNAYGIGTISKKDIINAQKQLDDDKGLLPALQQRLNIAKHALAIMLGKTPAAYADHDFRLEHFTLPAELPITIPSELVHARPDILAAETNLHGACAALGLAKANFFPTLLLTANSLQEALTPGGLFKAINNTFAIAANLTAPLYRGGTLIAEKEKAIHGYNQMVAQYQQTILIAFQEVADSLTALLHDQDLVISQQQAVDAAKAKLELSYQSFNAGTIGLLDIQTEQRALSLAQLNLIYAIRQRFLDTAQLFVALGGSPVAAKCSQSMP